MWLRTAGRSMLMFDSDLTRCLRGRRSMWSFVSAVMWRCFRHDSLPRQQWKCLRGITLDSTQQLRRWRLKPWFQTWHDSFLPLDSADQWAFSPFIPGRWRPPLPIRVCSSPIASFYGYLLQKWRSFVSETQPSTWPITQQPWTNHLEFHHVSCFKSF